MSVTLTAVSSGSNYKQGSSYPPSSYIGNDDGGSTVYVDRQKSGATFTTDTAYVRFNGAALAGQGTVASATLRLRATTKQDGDNKYSLTCEFYDFGGSSDSGDFAEEATVPVIVPVDVTGISTSAYTDIPLTDLSGITTGNFGFRITLVSQSTAAPAGTNGLEITSHTGTNKPQLVVDFAAGGNDTNLGVASETDTVNPLGRARSRALGVASEADAVNALGRARARAIGFVSETDSVSPVARRRSLTLGVAPEAEIVHPLGRARSRSVGMSLEFDGALPVGRARSRDVGVAGETDQATGLGRARSHVLGVAREQDSVLPLEGGNEVVGGDEDDPIYFQWRMS